VTELDSLNCVHFSFFFVMVSMLILLLVGSRRWRRSRVPIPAEPDGVYAWTV
jgi:hypothetical protein